MHNFWPFIKWRKSKRENKTDQRSKTPRRAYMKGLNRSGYVNQGKEELWKDDTVFKYMKAAIKK